MNVRQLLKDFNVESEEELLEKLKKDSETIPCAICGKEYNINYIKFLDSDPYCLKCLRK
jgi:hypothetical protein